MEKICACCFRESEIKKLEKFFQDYAFCGSFSPTPPQTEADWNDVDVLFLFRQESAWPFIAEAAHRHHTALVALTDAAGFPEAEQSVADTGTIVLAGPVSHFLLAQILRMAAQASAQLRALQDENNRLRTTIGDLKLIDRAKCALIQYLGMTEPNAHRFIEKQAMNKRSSKREIALEILAAYEP